MRNLLYTYAVRQRGCVQGEEIVLAWRRGRHWLVLSVWLSGRDEHGCHFSMVVVSRPGLGSMSSLAPSIYFVSLTWKIDENGRIGARRRLSNTAIASTAIWLPSSFTANANVSVGFICIRSFCLCVLLLSLSVSLSADNANC